MVCVWAEEGRVVCKAQAAEDETARQGEKRMHAMDVKEIKMKRTR